MVKSRRVGDLAGMRVPIVQTARQRDPHSRLYRVVVVDDHPAIRLGLKSAIASEPDLVCVGVAGDGEEMGPLLYRTRPDAVILDYHLPRANGLALCRSIKSDIPAPAVLLYSAFADSALVVPTVVAGADGIVDKGAPARELFQAIRAIAGGGTVLPPLIPELVRAAGAALSAEDRPLLGMLIERRPPREIAGALGVGVRELDERVAGMLAQLSVPVPAATSGRGANERRSE